MNKYLRDGIMFAGGIVTGAIMCGCLTVCSIMKSRTMRKALAKCVADKWFPKGAVSDQKQRLINVVFDNKATAEDVLDQMHEICDTYSIVILTDYYDLAGVSAPSYTSNLYGWIELEGLKVVRANGGYTIQLPILKKLSNS